MEKTKLKEIFLKAFDIQEWCVVLREVFGAKSLLASPKPILLNNNDRVKSATELGSFATSDDRIIGLYHIVVNDDIWLGRNKVGLRELLRNIYRYDVDGALVVFEQGDKWRLSFISEIKVRNDEGKAVEQATEPKRYTYLLGVDEKVKTPLERLSKIAGKALALNDILNAFSVEALNEEFYKIISKYFYHLVGGIVGSGKAAKSYETKLKLPIPSENHRIYQEFVVRLIGRTIFCWFLKMKKSAEGVSLVPEGLLSSEAVKSNKNYYHNILERLFFQTLNTKMDERVDGLPESCKKIPFLNGGLFEPNLEDYYKANRVTGISEHLNTLVIEDEWFQEFFTELEKYNFTIDENSVTDVEVSVDPEMLGRIFENLLAEIDPDSGETARKATGSFYTPREIVDYMAMESLVQYIHNKTSILSDKIRPVFKMTKEPDLNFTKTESENILDALDKVRILDPACGSGAFPMGVLQKIVQALQKLDADASWWKKRQIERISNPIVRKALEEKLNSSSVEYARKIGVIQNSLYGVDIQPIAAEISKLRCFLTLIVDENIDETRPNRGIEPLPNLEFKFVTADTLQKLPEQDKQIAVFDSYNEQEELKNIRIEYLQSYGEQKNELKKQFKATQDKIAKKQLSFGSALDINSRAWLISTWDPFSHDKADWFDPQWMFGIEDFDIVIGNPPYVEHKKLKHIASKLKPHYEVYTGSSDLSVYFFERAFNLMQTKGILCYISTNKFFNTGYGKALRSYLTKKNIKQLINFEQVEVFKGVLVSSVVYLSENILPSNKSSFAYYEFQNEPNWKTAFNEKLKKRQRIYNQKTLTEAEWVFLKGNESYLKAKIESKGIKLKEIHGVEIKRGITTGYDPAFVISKELMLQLNGDLIKPLILGRDIKKYKKKFNDRFLINSHNGQKGYAERIDLERDYPSIYSYLISIDNESSGKVSNRTDKGHHWTNLRNCAFLNLFEKHKIVWPLTADQWGYAIDTESNYMTSGGFFLVSKEFSIKALLAILNSKVLEYYFKFIGVMTAGGAFTLKKATIELLPIAIPENNLPFEIMADYMVLSNSFEKFNNINPEISNSHIIQLFEDVIDAMVMELYFEEDFKKAGIEFIKYAERDFESIDGKSEPEQIDIINKAYQKLNEKDNEISKNLKLMDIKLADIVLPIKSAK